MRRLGTLLASSSQPLLLLLQEGGSALLEHRFETVETCLFVFLSAHRASPRSSSRVLEFWRLGSVEFDVGSLGRVVMMFIHVGLRGLIGVLLRSDQVFLADPAMHDVFHAGSVPQRASTESRGDACPRPITEIFGLLDQLAPLRRLLKRRDVYSGVAYHVDASAAGGGGGVILDDLSRAYRLVLLVVSLEASVVAGSDKRTRLPLRLQISWQPNVTGSERGSILDFL